jgi:hypothetical protein
MSYLRFGGHSSMISVYTMSNSFAARIQITYITIESDVCVRSVCPVTNNFIYTPYGSLHNGNLVMI